MTISGWADLAAHWRVEGNGEGGPLNWVATWGSDGIRIGVEAVYPSSPPVRALLDLPVGTVLSGAFMQQIADPFLDAANRLIKPERIRMEPGPATVIGSAVEGTFPGRSASVVVMQIQ